MHEKYGSKGVACLSVSIDRPDDQELALKFLRRQKAAFTNVLLDEPVKTWQEIFDIFGPPAALVYDRDGKVAGRFDHNDVNKAFTYEDVEKLVVRMIK
jgi:hypothetical protein